MEFIFSWNGLNVIPEQRVSGQPHGSIVLGRKLTLLITIKVFSTSTIQNYRLCRYEKRFRVNREVVGWVLKKKKHVPICRQWTDLVPR